MCQLSKRKVMSSKPLAHRPSSAQRQARRISSLHFCDPTSSFGSVLLAKITLVRFPRLLPVLALLLTLPLYGVAGIVSAFNCQGQAPRVNAIAAMDCCPDHGGHDSDCNSLADQGHPVKTNSCSMCKAGFGCKSPTSFEPVHVLTISPVLAHDPGSAEPPPLLSAHSPDGLWRPPRLT